jgi:tetratricopeptide (TPR) repeat protein
MKTAKSDFKQQLRAIRRARRNGNADAALAELEKMLKTWPDHPHLLVEKSRLIQLSENPLLPLAHAKRALKRAIAVDDDSPTPWIELGYYLFVIDDQDEKAEEKFDRAIELALRHLIEAITGKLEAVLDQDDPLRARKVTDLGDLVRLGQILAGRYQKNDSPEIGRLSEYIARYQERFEDTPKSRRNGKNGR